MGAIALAILATAWGVACQFEEKKGTFKSEGDEPSGVSKFAFGVLSALWVSAFVKALLA